MDPLCRQRRLSGYRFRTRTLTLKLTLTLTKQACAAEIAVRYAALTCKQNKRYRTSARLTKTRDRCSKISNNGTDGQTDGQTDRQTDRQSATQYAAPSYGGGPHNKTLFLTLTRTLQIQEAHLMLTTGSTRLAVSRDQQTWYHSTCNI